MTAVAVCGFGRCGSTMMMKLLEAGGITPVDGSAPISYELPDSKRFPTLTAADVDGRAVKLLDAVLYGLMPRDHSIDWRVIWLDRDPHQQARSQVKLIRALTGQPVGPMAAYRFAESYRKDRHKALPRFRSYGQLYVTSYESFLTDPHNATGLLATFLAPTFALDVAAAAAVVHDRTPDMRPDIDFERTGLPPAATTSRRSP